MMVSISLEGEEGTGIGAAFEFFSFFWSNSRLLGLENSSDVIKYPFVGLTKTLFGVKFVVKISRDGTKEVFKCLAYTHTPPPPQPTPLRLDIDTWIIIFDWHSANLKREGA